MSVTVRPGHNEDNIFLYKGNYLYTGNAFWDNLDQFGFEQIELKLLLVTNSLQPQLCGMDG